MPITPHEATRLAAEIEDAPLPDDDAQDVLDDWRVWARPSQLPPEGAWRVWLLLAGRGFGKTRSGAEWVRRQAESGAAAGVRAFEAPAHLAERRNRDAVLGRRARPAARPAIRRCLVRRARGLALPAGVGHADDGLAARPKSARRGDVDAETGEADPR